jgi:RNA polymerase sigma-32 factor
MAEHLNPVPVPSSLSAYIREVEKYPPLTPEEERALAIAYYERGDREAAKKLVLSHLRYALSMALKYQHLAPLMDLIQEANLGLMEAVKRFNPYQGFRLITYATYWIRERLQRTIEQYQSIVRRGTTRDERKVKRQLPRLLREASQSGTGELTLYEIADRLEVKPEAVQAMIQKKDVELDAMHGEDEDQTLHNLIPSPDATPLERIVEEEEKDLIAKAVESFIHSLTPREREIFEARILRNDSGKTLATLARTYGVSRERIRQIESRLKERLKKAVALALEGNPPSPALPPPKPQPLPHPDGAGADNLPPKPASPIKKGRKGAKTFSLPKES